MRFDVPRALLGALALTLLVAVVVAASTSTAAFGVFNPSWDGTGELRSIAESRDANATVSLNASAYERVPPERTVAVVLSPSAAYRDDASRVRTFVRRGGTLVVAEDFGPHGNRLLSAVGASARFDGRLLRDERTHHRSPPLPVATNVSRNATGNLTAGVDGLTLNYGTVVRPNGADVLVASSEFGYLDANRNGELDQREQLRSYPVATVERVGAGRVIAVSDPSAFVNAMLDRPGNRQFAGNVVATGDRVLLDYSHAGSQPPLSVALLHLRRSPLLQGMLVTLVVCGVSLAGLLVRRHGADADERWRSPDAITTYLVEERGWDADRATRLAEGVWGRRAERTDDE